METYFSESNFKSNNFSYSTKQEVDKLNTKVSIIEFKGSCTVWIETKTSGKKIGKDLTISEAVTLANNALTTIN